MSDKYNQLQLDDALWHLDQFRKRYGHLIVIPDVVTVADVVELRLDTNQGPQRVGDVCSPEEITAILRAFEGNPCSDPALLAHYALNDYRETNPVKKE